jgi:hypothetical protein
MTTITLDELRQLYDFEAEAALVSRTVQAALAAPEGRTRFFGHYTSWNGFFGSGVASLAGKIGRSRRLFLDPEETIGALADRSVYVASFFFDAARDEFDDRDTVHRDTHRCLAQAMLKGIVQSDLGANRLTANQVETLLREPPWLQSLNQRVAAGYGVGSPEDLPTIFASIGYHLGSELLADKEFTTIDQAMRTQMPELVEALHTSQIHIAGQAHSGYQWVSIHSGHGGGAEADHFKWATQGAHLAFRFVPPAKHAVLRQELHRGFLSFARDHREFFEHVNA